MKKTFYNVEDVMNILKVCQSEAYKVIRELNLELKEKNIRTKRGRVVAKYFEERYNIT